MSSLDELRNKWFLNFKSPQETFPPVARHNGTHVSNYTDRNLVTLLIDGENYMKEWHNSINDMEGPSCAVYHATWRLDEVRTLGYKKEGSSALETLKRAKAKGVRLYLLTCGNLYSRWINCDSLFKLGNSSPPIDDGCIDSRFPSAGSNHQKFVCLKNPEGLKAILGSIDISKKRWDTSEHEDKNENRDPDEKPTHDVGVKVEGPAVADLEWSFIERWNDNTRTTGLWSLREGDPVPPKIDTNIDAVSKPKNEGNHSVQVLHTYGKTSRFGYSWSPVGEFTIWASYLNAIKIAEKYIYIEDQYFLPFDSPPCHDQKGKARDSDIIYQLGEAIKRGVKVLVVVPCDAEDYPVVHEIQKYQRNLGVEYLTTKANSNRGKFMIASLHNGISPIYVHSKLMICDDEFVLVGSANIGQRSMTHDSELHIGIVDEKNQFAREFRKTLWAEHLGLKNLPDNCDEAYEIFEEYTESSKGRVRHYSTDEPSKIPWCHGWRLRHTVDPYAGPPRS